MPARTGAIDRTVELPIDGSLQKIRMCGDRHGLPPLLVVQAGPGFPLLHEVARFRKRLKLERDFLTCYWDQRGCGAATRHDAESVSSRRQVDDLSEVLRWLNAETGAKVIVLAVSLGATFALQAAEREPGSFAFIAAISPDAQARESDASAAAFLRARSAKDTRLQARLAKLGEPPYLDPSKFQLRARLLADLGSIESGKRFGSLLRETLFGLVASYGLFGTARALNNMDRIQRRILPELTTLDLVANPPRPKVPVHFVFGEEDALVPGATASRLAAAIPDARNTSVRVPGAGHLVHFDHPEVVRSILLKESKSARGGELEAAGSSR